MMVLLIKLYFFTLNISVISVVSEPNVDDRDGKEVSQQGSLAHPALTHDFADFGNLCS